MIGSTCQRPESSLSPARPAGFASGRGHSLAAATVATEGQSAYPRLAQSPGERAGPHGIRLLRRLGWSSWGVGADDAGEFVLLDRLKEVHQTAVDALRQTGQASHNVVLDNEGDTRVSSPCPRKTSSDDSVADSNLLQLAMFGEPGLAECSDVHLVAGNFPSH
ncbi:hypothetical protein SprV_0802562900 [Sparganum proliferum]